jgi:hypothetical protein
MNPCELVARLNPGSVRLDGGGRGGIPEYTAQDIAAAIGMACNDPDKPLDELAREMFCAVWWPDGAELVWHRLDALLAAAQFGEWRERLDELVIAQIAMAQARVEERKSRQKAIERAEGMLIRAREAMWPALSESAYAAVRKAVVAELRAPRTCPVCHGRGQVKSETLVVSCAPCAGTGRVAISNAQRARMLERNESTYRRAWLDVYEWTFGHASSAELRGRAAIAERLDQRAA